MLAIIDKSTTVFQIALVLATLLAACILCLVVALCMRRWVKEGGPASRQEGGFTLSDLRQMYRSGQLSAEEFERAKEKIVAAARRNMLAAGKAGPAAGPRPPTAPSISPGERGESADPADPGADGAQTPREP